MVRHFNISIAGCPLSFHLTKQYISRIQYNGRQALEYIMIKMASVNLESSGYVVKAAKNDATPNADIKVPLTMLKILANLVWPKCSKALLKQYAWYDPV